jgi:hypothetical protein
LSGVKRKCQVSRVLVSAQGGRKGGRKGVIGRIDGPVAQCPVAQCPVAQCPVAQCPVAQCTPDQCTPDQDGESAVFPEVTVMG